MWICGIVFVMWNHFQVLLHETIFRFCSIYSHFSLSLKHAFDLKFVVGLLIFITCSGQSNFLACARLYKIMSQFILIVNRYLLNILLISTFGTSALLASFPILWISCMGEKQHGRDGIQLWIVVNLEFSVVKGRRRVSVLIVTACLQMRFAKYLPVSPYFSVLWFSQKLFSVFWINLKRNQTSCPPSVVYDAHLQFSAIWSFVNMA